MSSRSSVRRHPLCVEPLEGREMPAANVLATFADGVLTVTTADPAAAEHLRMKMAELPDAFSSTQLVLVLPADPGTTVNGTVGFVTPVGQIVRAVRVDLKGGDDQLNVSGLQLTGGLTVRAGDGNNVVFVDGNTRLGGSLAVSGGTGNDLIRLVNGVYVAGAASVSAGAGANDVGVSFGVRVGGSLSVTAGPGADTLKLGDLVVGGATTVALGDGANAVIDENTDSRPTQLVGLARFTFGPGADTFDLAPETLLGASLTVGLGAGTNLVELEGITAARGVSVTGGPGTDIIRVADGEFAGSLSVALGEGVNHFSMDDVADSPFSGPANVIASTRGTTVLGALTITSGSDFDQIQIGDERPVRVMGATTIRTGDEVGSGDLVVIDDASFHGPFLLATGAGADSVVIDFTESAFGTTLFGGPTTIRGGAGADFLQLGRANTPQSAVFFAVRPVLDGGAGTQDLFNAVDYFLNGPNTQLGEVGWEL